MALKPWTITATGDLQMDACPATLGTVNVNTAAASAVFKIYDNASAGSGTPLCTIDASIAGTRIYMVKAGKGLYGVLSGGNADITVGTG